MDEIIREIAENAYREWGAQLKSPAVRKLTDITQHHCDRAYECGDIPNRIKVDRVDTPCGATFICFHQGDELLEMCKIEFECSQKDCPHADTCGSGKPGCAVYELMQKV